MSFIIDRFEGNYAVVEASGENIPPEMLHIPKTLLPIEAREGDLLQISIDTEGTALRKEAIRKRTRRLWEDAQ